MTPWRIALPPRREADMRGTADSAADEPLADPACSSPSLSPPPGDARSQSESASVVWEEDPDQVELELHLASPLTGVSTLPQRMALERRWATRR